MKTVELVVMKGSTPSEIFQSIDAKIAFVNKKYEQMSLGVKCRDFLGDCIWSQKTGKIASIYGFSYSYKKTPYDLTKTCLSIKTPNDKEYNSILNNIGVLNSLEKEYGIKQTKILLTQEKNTLVLEGDKLWQSNVWKISLYSFLLKLLCYDLTHGLVASKYSSPEDSYAKTLFEKDNLHLLMSNLHMMDEVVHKEIGMAHNYSGFISVLNRKTDTYKYLNTNTLKEAA